MADDLYSYLVGAPPSDKDQIKAVVDQLRRRRSFGELGALTGDKILQPYGQGMIKEADTSALQLQSERQKAIDDAQTEAYQSGQLKHMGNMEDITRRGQDFSREVGLANAMAAMERANNANKPKNNKFTFADRTKLEGVVGNLNTMEGQLNDFKDEFTQQVGSKAGPLNKLPNALANLGYGSDNMKEAADWWANWRAFYTIQQRNKMFGATLTPHEKKAWEEADISPQLDPKQIRNRIGVLLKTFKERAAIQNRTYRSQFGDDIIDPYGLPGDEEAGLTPPGAAPSGKGPKRVKVDADGNPIGN